MKMIIVWNNAKSETNFVKEYSQDSLDFLGEWIFKELKKSLKCAFNVLISSGDTYHKIIGFKEIFSIYEHAIELASSDDFELHLNDVNQYFKKMGIAFSVSIVDVPI